MDLGATSLRAALGVWEGGRIRYEIRHQMPNLSVDDFWDLPAIEAFVRDSEELAASEGASLGIDSWGVDVVIKSQGREASSRCYRHPAHQSEFDLWESSRRWLYDRTGIQALPLNTVYQLLALNREDPCLPEVATWSHVPDYLVAGLVGEIGFEGTMASTTQLMGLDGQWCFEVFEKIGWPVPSAQPVFGPSCVGMTSLGVPVVRVASHDTASAVVALAPDGHDAFLNVGTWALLGQVLASPLVSEAAYLGNWSNERAFDGRIRFLKNFPAFYLLNRVHDELGVQGGVADWLAAGEPSGKTLDVLDKRLFAPGSMVSACSEILGSQLTEAEWAGTLLDSIVLALSTGLSQLETMTGQKVNTVHVGGGGAASNSFCESLALVTGKTIRAAAQEATVLGNLACQFMARGCFHGDDLSVVCSASTDSRFYHPVNRT